MSNRTLTTEQIDQLQELRYKDVPTEQILQTIPGLNLGLIKKYAPSHLRGQKRMVAEYIADHPNVSFNEIDANLFGGDFHKIAHAIYELRRAGLLTFKERKSVITNGHGQARGTNEKGIFNINLTPLGVKRVEVSRTKRTVPTRPSAVAATFRKLPPEVLDYNYRDTIHGEVIEALAPTAAVAEPAPAVTTNEYPILAKLRQREDTVKAAGKLLDEATNLYSQADMDTEAIQLLDAMKSLQVKFTPLELEYMNFANKCEQSAKGGE